ncbi:MAG: TraR/DksA family transcriptional regulator [Verrucomicrobiae bacterium]|nr:TraR/DksA family transcriptional regulator [Verrucomicrobiae bacterium]
MTADTLQAYKQRLEAQLGEIRRAVSEHDQGLRDSHSTTVDFTGPDRASELEGLEVENRVLDSEENLIAKIEHALGRIDSGAYGLCEGCGEPIPEARLDAKPSVSLCVDCQSEKEAAEG